MSGPVPTATSLREIYSEDAIPAQKERWSRLLSSFEQQFNHPAEFVSRSPGRVNIIGEHIDYSLYEVLPMAVTADVLLAVHVHPPSKDTPRVKIANINPTKFPPSAFEIPLKDDIPIDVEAHDWSNYFKSGLRGALSLLRSRKSNHGDSEVVPRSMDVLVDGTVPSGGGLSSSAAFVCASALAVMIANGEHSVDKRELVELAIVSERAVGVYSGGMDQAASVFAQRGTALHVTFTPALSALPITLPRTTPSLVFVIAQSFVAADKHATAPVCYNLRVVECALAAAVLAKHLHLPPLPHDAAPLNISLRGLQDTYFATHHPHPPPHPHSLLDTDHTPSTDLSTQLRTLAQLTEKHLPNAKGYTRAEIAATLGISIPSLEKRYLSKFTVRGDRFLLRQRALHVFTEALRVRAFMALLQQAPPSDDLPRRLGQIMNETQESCRTLYDCSCAELDELCSLARQAGAYGSRLTGAGWGGCSVHLVAEDRVDAVRRAWVEGYYNVRFPGISEERLKEAIVVSKPGSGSCVFQVGAPGSELFGGGEGEGAG